MIDKLKALWDRVTIHWHVVAALLIAALPEILDYLGVVDLKPILSQFLPENYVTLIISVLPFVLAFLRPMLVVTPAEDE
jgi:hypothetical protein